MVVQWVVRVVRVVLQNVAVARAVQAAQVIASIIVLEFVKSLANTPVKVIVQKDAMVGLIKSSYFVKFMKSFIR